ncbi:MAG TPA: metal ABC transporter substrate-binding protein [Candidatus Limnocylindria bacterium]|nr:metal ABC transporter substrate-binding protein [Candidatus Limnocylindria bacterium]
MLRLLTSLVLAAALLAPGVAAAKVRVAASLNDFASIASSVGGDQVEVFAVARPTSDAHRVEALPSYMVRVSRAQLYLKVGLGLDQWADAIIDGSRNSRLTVVDCSRGVRVLEVPTGRVDASMGDVHPSGNPHYWLDPRNGAVVAGNVAEALARVDPAHASEYRERAATFAVQAEAARRRGRESAEGLTVKTVFTYHRSWSYFADAFGLDVAGTVEPVPGIPPTARHLAQLVQIAKSRHVRLLIQEPYFSKDAGRFLGRQAGVQSVVAAPSCDAPAAGSYLAHFSRVLADLAKQASQSPSP